jgi:hypothetical protein
LRHVVRAIALLAGLFMLSFGLWALIDPRSFYEQIATYPPYNVHLFHDAGAFQAGIGAALIVGPFATHPLTVALVGGSAGFVLHAIAHIIDRDLGGRSSDPVVLSVFALGVLFATAVHLARQRQVHNRS